ncbi:MAG: c-type cytochrome, partial [Planctomycetia bacterium]|nr:c-type cytochrome [Planctomycetia bacterium]
DDEDDDFIPGLVARYTAEAKTVDRIDRDVQFDWGADSPDVRLPAGPFSATWTGKLLIRTDGRHAYHLYLNGEATIKLNGKTVVSGRRDTPGWIAGELIDIEDSEPKIEIAYRQTGAQALVRLFWSSEKFPTEPIPPQIFFRDAPHRDLDLIVRGGELFDAYRCQACHRGAHDEPAEPTPALAKQGVAVSREWLIDWLVAPHRRQAHARMPEFGFSRDAARAVAEYLAMPAADDANRIPEGEQGPEQTRRGEVLFRSIGCLACHTRGNDGSPAILGGGDLTDIARKRSPGWLSRWLKDPEKLNPDHRMPVFKLTDDERRQLALYLTAPRASQEMGSRNQSGGPAAPVPQPPSAQKLLESARCAACHRVDGMKPNIAGIPTLEQPVKDWAKACTEAAADSKHLRPAFVLNDDDCRAIRAFVDSRAVSRAVESPFARGARLLRQKGCVQCHERDGGRGIATIAGQMGRVDKDLAGQSEALVPPNLSAVGDKLRDDALGLAIAGKQKTNRLPWLRVRMPQFEHKPEEAAALLNHLVSHDRIPAGAPQIEGSAEPAGVDPKDARHLAELCKSGQVLAGTRGFSCTACHKIASYEPRNVASATRGSDLYLIGQRMRPEYFVRWTRSPLRVVPGMEMPSFERPVSGILDGKIDQQLAALWEGLNDKSAPPKLDTSTIEQFLTVTPGEQPKIIRDVFNIGDSHAPRFVPRAMVIGFDHGMNLLYDLDAMSLRGWWTGDFARQRASGKSWFWEPATVNQFGPARAAPDVGLCRAGIEGAPTIIAKRESGRFGRLLKYETGLDGSPQSDVAIVRLQYRLVFQLEDGDIELNVKESLSRMRTLWPTRRPTVTRKVVASNVPSGYELVFASGESIAPGGEHRRIAPEKQIAQTTVTYSAGDAGERSAFLPTPVSPLQPELITSVPGYDGVRLPFPMSIMPTAITLTADGTLAFCSLKGQVYLAKDTDGDGIEDKLILFEEGLAAPYGLIADGNDLLVAHKPELLRLRDTNGDGRADVREVVADGWGYTEDYHDWTTGIVRDSNGNLYVGTGSDYAKPGRDREKSKWRGKVLRVDKAGRVTPLGHAFRYPTGLAITPDDQIFVSDNQGVQNTFNEINHLVEGASYGVPSLFEENPKAPATLPAIQVPHPWTRSVNGLFFLPRAKVDAAHPFAGHGIGCEYDSRFLVRFTVQRVGDTFQGAVYPLSVPTLANAREGFLGTLCGAVSPKGDIYIGSIYDSGWLGGPNIGDIVRLRPNGKLPAGIREITAAENEFRISFTSPVDKSAAAKRESYEISGYTRKWQGSYATPDSGRHQLAIESVDMAADGLSVVLHVTKQQPGHVYEITCGKIRRASQPVLWPAIGHYTLNVIPK